MRSPAVWRAPVLRARRAIDSAIGRIGTSGRVIDATLRFSANRPEDRVRQLLQLSTWLDQAVARLERAIHDLEASAEPDAPEYAEFALLFLGATFRCLETIVRLDKLSARAAGASGKIVRTSPRDPRLELVIVRRSPAAFATVADAARRVSRGRAPPLS